MMNSYRTKDGRWFFFTGLEADRHIDKIYRALGREDLHDDPRFENARALRKNRIEVIAVLDDIIGQEPLERVGRAFRPRGRVVGTGADAGRGARGPAARWPTTVCSS